jgi:hypothetical protein
MRARLHCVKDFLKRCALFPVALVCKAFKTVFKIFGLSLAVLLVLITVGSSVIAREFFLDRISLLAKDLADWILLPLVLISSFVRLFLALFIHPNFYSSSFS